MTTSPHPETPDGAINNIPPSTARESTDRPQADEPSDNGKQPSPSTSDSAQPFAELLHSFAELTQLVDRSMADEGDRRQELARLFAEVQRLRTDDQVLTSLSEQCREFNEQRHEKEFVAPVLLGLIAILDRAQSQTEGMADLLEKANIKGNSPASLAIRCVLESRKADCAELENLLATYGAEAFQHPGEKFDPVFQTCGSQLKCQNPALHGHTAHRLRPGYTRHGKILRHESVSIWVS